MAYTPLGDGSFVCNEAPLTAAILDERLQIYSRKW